MNKKTVKSIILLLVFIFIFMGCTSVNNAGNDNSIIQPSDTVFQVGTINALLKGGHLLECNLEKGDAYFDKTDDFYMCLPSVDEFSKTELEKEVKNELNKVE